MTSNTYSGDLLPLSDRNAWYYPSLGHDSDEEELGVGLPEGNWGHKNTKGARWVRRGKITPWGPEMEDWEVRSIPPYSLNAFSSILFDRQKNEPGKGLSSYCHKNAGHLHPLPCLI